MATLPHRMNSILIVFIFRPNQDPSQYSNYRPMSLINLGIKMISKDLSFRLGSIISALTNTDQTRFPINPHDFWWHYWIPRRCLIGVEWSVPFSSFSHFRFGTLFPAMDGNTISPKDWTHGLVSFFFFANNSEMFVFASSKDYLQRLHTNRGLCFTFVN